MSKLQHDEPNLEDIDDFNDNETPEKRNTVKLIVVGILIVGAIYSYFKANNNQLDEYVGTPEKPGVDVSKGKY